MKTFAPARFARTTKKPAIQTRLGRPIWLRLMVAALLPVLIGSQFAPSAAGAGGSGAGGTGGSGSAPPYVPPTYPLDSLQASTAPIKLPGSGGVSDTGAATYSMPFDVPDGPGGLTPSIGLSYGGAGNGSLGVGFGVSGLSTIAPCHKTFASEGHADGVDFDASDAYCLDGQKLVERGDLRLTTDAFDRVFSTEVESFVRVVVHRDATADPQPTAFTVYHADGRRARYEPVIGTRRRGVAHDADPAFAGHGDEDAADSRQARVAVAYPITKLWDRSGNEIRYHYTIDADVVGSDFEMSWRIANIEYSYTSGTPRRRIVFSHEPRPDPIVQYVSGVKVVTRSRLKTIQVWAPNPTSQQLVWQYQLGYELSADTRRSRLTSLRKVDQFNVASWERRFEWTNLTASVTDSTTAQGPEFAPMSFSRDLNAVMRLWQQNPHGTAYVYDEPWVQRSDVRLMVFDADGDGVDDVLYRTLPSRVQYDASARDITYEDDEELPFLGGLPYTMTPGRIYLRTTAQGLPLNHREDVTAYLEPTTTDGLWIAHLGKSRVADTNGDGQPNLLLARTYAQRFAHSQYGDIDNYGKWQFGYFDAGVNQGSVWSDPQGPLWTDRIDWEIMRGPMWHESSEDPFTINGDGKLLWKYLIPPFQRVLADMDGDGRVEPVDAFLEGDSGGNVIDLEQFPYTDFDWGRLGTVNDDTSFFPWMTYLSSEAAGTDIFGNEAKWTCGNSRALVTDYEGDGRADVMVASAVHLEPSGTEGVYQRLRVGDPEPLTGVQATDSQGTSGLWGGDCSQNRPDVIAGDFNGDGLEDVLYPPQSFEGNTLPQIRWNLGNGYERNRDYPVDDPALGARMYSEQPISPKSAAPVGWDLGTRAVDLNRDGLTDILAMRFADPDFLIDGVAPGDDLSVFDAPKIIIAYISTGSGFVATNLGQWNSDISVAEGFTTFQVGDVSGDGATDIVHVVDGTIVTTELPWRNPSDLLKSVGDTSSNHPLELFGYTNQWWGGGARPAPEVCLYPVTCPRRSFPVVRQHAVYVGSRANGEPRYRTTLHSYKNPRVNLRGRGFLGFEEHRIWDQSLGAEMVRTFDNSYPYDPEPLIDGGEFYPFASSAVSVRSTTPIDEMPDEADIGGSNFPGHSGDVVTIETRTVITDLSYELRHHRSAAGNGVVTILPSASVSSEQDVLATAFDLNQSSPFYDAFWQPTEERATSTSNSYDAHGQPLVSIRHVEDGVETVVERAYEDRVGPPATSGPPSPPTDWILGLETLSEVQSVEPNSGEPPVGRVRRITYDAMGRPLTIKMSGRDVAFYDCLSVPLVCETLELKGVTTTIASYDTSGNPLVVTSTAPDVPLPRTATIVYDSDRVYPTHVVDPLGFTNVSLRHPAFGVPVLSVDANGVTTTAKYDGFGRGVKTVTPGAPNVTRVFSALSGNKGMLIDTYTEAGAALDWAKESVVLDDIGRPIGTSQRGFDGTSINSSTEYDHFGNAVWQTNPWVGTPTTYGTRSTYDRLGRLVSTLGPDWSLTEHTYSMFTTTTEDPMGNVTYVERDVSGRVIASGHVVGGTRRGKVGFTYGPFDEVKTVRDPGGNVTVKTYDALGRLATTSDPDAGDTEFQHDGFGQLRVQQRANGDLLTYDYDVVGRLKSMAGPQGTDTYVYDTGVGAKGALTSATSFDGGITTAFAYDPLGRAVEVSKTVDGVTRKINRQYDAWGRLTHLLYPTVAGMNRFVTQFEYGVGGHLRRIADASACSSLPCTTATNLWQVLARNQDLSITQAKYGPTQTEAREYYVDSGRLKKLTAAGTTLNYEYNLDGNIRKRFDQSNRVEYFEYDDFDRLSKWTLTPPPGRTPPPSIVTTYSYSDGGNLEMVRKDGTATFVGVYGSTGTPNQLTASSGLGGLTSYTYDDLGRQETGAGRTIGWAQIDKPKTITEGGVTKTFRYDAFGDRTVKQSPGKKTIYFDKLHERRENGSSISDVFFVYGEPGVVAQVDYANLTATTRYMVGDDQSTVNITTVGAGTPKRDYFDPFGRRIDKDGNAAVDLDASTTMGYTGQEEDDGSLVNMNGRIYDRKQYRFLSPDPVISDPLFGQSYNPYSYVVNNPVRYTDPSGYMLNKGDGAVGGEFTGYDEIEAGATKSDDPLQKKKPGPLVKAVDPPVQAPQASDASAGKTSQSVSHTKGDERQEVDTGSMVSELRESAREAEPRYRFFAEGGIRDYTDSNGNRVHVSGDIGGMLDLFGSEYDGHGQSLPGWVTFGLGFVPIIGQGMALLDTLEALENGDYGDAALSATGIVGGGYGKMAVKGGKAVVGGIGAGVAVVKKSRTPLKIRNRLPRSKLSAAPSKRGNAPIGLDDRAVVLHHVDQTMDGRIDELLASKHHSNYGKLHTNTGQTPSLIDRWVFNGQRKAYWKQEWDRGRFNGL